MVYLFVGHVHILSKRHDNKAKMQLLFQASSIIVTAEAFILLVNAHI